MNFFFFRELHFLTALLLIRNFYTSRSTWFISLKTWVGFSIFDFVSFFLKLCFCSTKIMDSFTLKRHNSFLNKNNSKATRSFALRPLIFKLQQEVRKFNDIYVTWNSPKTDPKTNFLNLENRKFDHVTFSQ